MPGHHFLPTLLLSVNASEHSDASLTLPAELVCWAAWQGPADAATVWALLSCCLCPLVQCWLLVGAGCSFLPVYDCVLDPATHSISLVTDKAATY